MNPRHLRTDIRAVTAREWVELGLVRETDANEGIEVDVPLAFNGSLVASWATSPTLTAIAPDEPLPLGTQLADVFGSAAFGKRLLLVGAPGSGKSTHLLRLVAALINTPLESANVAPCPVVLLLSTWRAPDQTFDAWLIDQLARNYGLPAYAAAEFLDDGSLGLMLDGLDEIPEVGRERKLSELNHFLVDSARRATAIVVTCREQEYEQFGARLNLTSALRVQPLPLEVVNQELERAGASLRPVRQMLAADPALQRVLSTPLMVVLTILAYRSEAPTEALDGDVSQIRQQIFEMYEDAMLTRERPLYRIEAGSDSYAEPRYQPQQTHHYLVQLARLMQRKHELVLYSDELTPEWLPEKGEEELLPQNGPKIGMFAKLTMRSGLDHASTGTVGLLLGASLGSLFILPLAVYVWGWQVGLMTGLGLSLSLGLAIFWLFGIARMKPFGRSVAVVLDDDANVPRAATRWYWVGSRALRWSPVALALGAVCFGIAVSGVSGGEALSAAATFSAGSIIGTGMVPDYERRPGRPGEALQASGRWLLALFGGTFVVDAVVVGITALIGGPWVAAVAAIPLSTSLLMVTGPGRAWLRTRALLYGGKKSGLLPADLVAFLDHGTERALLRRQGGGYAFLHAEIQHYFADCNADILPRARN